MILSWKNEIKRYKTEKIKYYWKNKIKTYDDRKNKIKI